MTMSDYLLISRYEYESEKQKIRDEAEARVANVQAEYDRVVAILDKRTEELAQARKSSAFEMHSAQYQEIRRMKKDLERVQGKVWRLDSIRRSLCSQTKDQAATIRRLEGALRKQDESSSLNELKAKIHEQEKELTERRQESAEIIVLRDSIKRSHQRVLTLESSIDVWRIDYDKIASERDALRKRIKNAQAELDGKGDTCVGPQSPIWADRTEAPFKWLDN